MSPANSQAQDTNAKSKQSYLPVTPDKQAWLKSKIRDIPDFPKPGIMFRDLTTLLKDTESFSYVIHTLAEKFRPLNPKYIAGIEARGFILATALAHELKVGFIPIRKPGKLPHKVESVSYELEYGTDSVEIHVDAIEKGERTVLIDDLLATGGTAAAGFQLLKNIGSDVVGIGFVVELEGLDGRKRLPSDIDVFSLVTY